jgi:23S rRNA pseudouridine2604 synthase
MVELKRINKYIGDSGYCSRREGDRLVARGAVLINGERAEMGSKVGEGDVVSVDGKLIKVKTKKVYLAFNKPVGVTCTTDTRDPDNIIDYIGYKERIFPIGRLDKMSEGLIFLTNDGDIVNKILRAGNLHEKEYVVRIDKVVTKDFLKKMGSGVEILDQVTKPCKVEKVGEKSFRIILTQGLNRQIRRMCEALGRKVLKLKRVRIMNARLDGIESGKWRYLSKDEMKGILRDTEGSSKVA